MYTYSVYNVSMHICCRLFDLVLITDDLSLDYQEEVAHHILLQTLNRGDNCHERVPRNDLKQVIDCLNHKLLWQIGIYKTARLAET